MTPEQMRQHAKEARVTAKNTHDPLAKARLHEIATILERVADEIEGAADPQRRN